MQVLSSGQRVTGDRADSLFIDDPQPAATIHSAHHRPDELYPARLSSANDDKAQSTAAG
jgi:hypothetical protein